MIKLCNTLLYYLTLIQANQGRYPHIFKLAMDIIPIQASSVPCERVFSSGKETMAPRQRRISPDLMEALQVLKFSIHKGSSSLSFTDGMSWEDELKEFELMARTIPSEDPDTYSRNLNVAENNEDDLDLIVEEATTKALEDLEDKEDGDEGSEIEYSSG